MKKESPIHEILRRLIEGLVAILTDPHPELDETHAATRYKERHDASDI